MASKPWSVLDQNRETEVAPGSTAAMPMMAISEGFGAGRQGRRKGRAGESLVEEIGLAVESS